LLIVAFISGLLQTVAVLPSLAWGAAMARGMFDVLADYFDRVLANPEAYRFADQQALQAELQERLRSVLVPLPDPSALTAIGSGLGGAVGLIGTAALTAVALSIAAGRPIPVLFAIRLVAARAGLVKPIVALGLGWTAISWLSTAIQASPDVQAWAGAAGSPRSLLIGSLLSVLARSWPSGSSCSPSVGLFSGGPRRSPWRRTGARARRRLTRGIGSGSASR
jgi:hypothetical protein